MDWSTFFTWTAQGIIGFLLAVFVLAVIAGVSRSLRGDAETRHRRQEEELEGYMDSLGGPWHPKDDPEEDDK